MRIQFETLSLLQIVHLKKILYAYPKNKIVGTFCRDSIRKVKGN